MGSRSSKIKVYNFIRIVNLKKIKHAHATMPVDLHQDFLNMETICTNFRIQNGMIVPFLNYDVRNSTVKISDAINADNIFEDRLLLIQIHLRDFEKYNDYWCPKNPISVAREFFN